jgi:hypothetical protein
MSSNDRPAVTGQQKSGYRRDRPHNGTDFAFVGLVARHAPIEMRVAAVNVQDLTGGMAGPR